MSCPHPHCSGEMACRGWRSCSTWAAAILSLLSSVPERSGEHLLPAFTLVAELCAIQQPEANSTAASVVEPAGISQAAPAPQSRADSVQAEGQPSTTQAALSSAEAGAERPAAGADGVRLVARLLMHRLSSGAVSEPQRAASADLQVLAQPAAERCHMATHAARGASVTLRLRFHVMPS